MKSFKIKGIGLLMVSMSVLLTSCLKDKGFDNGEYGAVRNTSGKSVNIRTSGLNNVQKSSVIIDTESPDNDTVKVDIDLNFATATTEPVTVKLAIDNSKVATYNSANSKNFQTTTTDLARLRQTEVTIPAGARTATVDLIIDQDKFDPTKSYMIPVSITEVSGGYQLTSNMNTRYFNIIGNPFAGTYNWDFTRYNNSDGSGTPSSLSFTGEQVTILPMTETKFTMPSGYYIQPRYEVSFTNNNGTYSNFKVELNKSDVADMKAGGVEVTNGPNIIVADPITKTFEFQYVVVSGGVAYRYIIDRYYK